MILIGRPSKTKPNQQRIVTAIVFCMLWILPGCGIPQLRCQDDVRSLPDTFNGEFSGENSAQIGVDEFFADPVLTNLISEGLSGNLQLKTLAEDIQIANNEVLRRRGMFLPFVNIGAGAGLDKFSRYTLLGADNAQNLLPNGTSFPSPLPNFLVAANLTWQIDIWRQLRNARDAASLRYLGSVEGRNYVVTRLVADIAESYYCLLALDKRMEVLDTIIALQQETLVKTKDRKELGRGNELAVQRFTAEVRKNQSEKLIIKQEIIEVENRINFLVGRFPQPVERKSKDFYDLNINPINLGLPSELLMNRPDIRQAERVLAASGLDVTVARANFYPKLNLTAGVGYEAFNTRYLFVSPESLVYNVAGDLVAPLINKTAIKAEYMSANAKQLQALYDYQRTILNAFTEVINRVNMVRNYTESIEIKRQQLNALESSVETANDLFQFARLEYLDVLFSQRDLNDARTVLINTKRAQLSAIVNTYQALGGGLVLSQYPQPIPENFEFILPTPSATPDNDPKVVPPTPKDNEEKKPDDSEVKVIDS